MLGPSYQHVAGSSSSRSFSTAKDIVRSTHARTGLLRGWNRLADAVGATLGPRGRNVVIEQMYGAPKITKDGVSVAKVIQLKDKLENCGAQLAKEVASKTNDMAGDGTTSATVLGRAIFKEGCKAVAADMNPMDLKRGIDHAVDLVLQDLAKRSVAISSPDEIKHVATIAANGDEVIGSLLAEAFAKVGKEGNITIQDGNTLEHELELVEGCRIDRGYISPYFISTTAATASNSSSGGSRAELEKPLVLLYEKKLRDLQPLLPILGKVLQTQRPLLVIAEDVEGEALAALVVNKLRKTLDVCAIKAPGFGENRRSMLHDLAVLTGGHVISEDVGGKLEAAELPSSAKTLRPFLRVTVAKGR
ncbi:unnamed protein product [Amoebophrya sp. A25]|nr:unnamed protein product [Amoebophrya sp. A25]|eukprot:GSA25T00014869001.1